MATPVLRESVIVIGLALLLSLLVKTWLMQAFFIPTGSMENTLVKDDRVIVNKLVPSPMALRGSAAQRRGQSPHQEGHRSAGRPRRLL